MSPSNVRPRERMPAFAESRGFAHPMRSSSRAPPQARVDLFVTNDDRLSRVLTPDVHFVTSLDRALL